MEADRFESYCSECGTGDPGEDYCASCGERLRESGACPCDCHMDGPSPCCEECRDENAWYE